MHKIYQGIRGYLQALKEHAVQAPPSPALLEVLAAFELRNRGHQHMLSDERMFVEHSGNLSQMGQEICSQKETIADTTRRLIMALIQTEATTKEASRLLPAAVLDAVDSSGWLEAYTLDAIRYLAHPLFSEHGPAVKEFRIFSQSCFRQKDYCVLHLRFCLERSAVIVEKSWNLSMPDVLSLSSALALVAAVSAVLTEDFKKFATWPEVSPNEIDAQVLADARKTFTTRLQMYPKNHQKLIKDNWDKVKPF
jgi:hypothetical protein